MAKAAKTAIKTKDQKAAADAKNWTKVIRAVRSHNPRFECLHLVIRDR